MLLRTRIVLFVIATVLMVATLLLTISTLREEAISDEGRENQLQHLTTAWELAVARASGRADQALGRLVTDPQLADAVATSDRGRISRHLASLELINRISVTDVNFFSKSEHLLFSSDDALTPRPLIGKEALRAVLDGAREVQGLRAMASGRISVVAASPIYVGDEIVGVAAAGVDFQLAITELRGNSGDRVFAIGRGDEMIEGADDPLWPVLQPLARNLVRGMVGFTHEGRSYQLAGIPVADLEGGRIAGVLVVSDVTNSLKTRRLWTSAYVAAILLVIAAAIGFLYAYLCRSFETLDLAVAAIHDLSQGRTAAYIDLPPGNDEIGRIAVAVDVFRGVMNENDRSAGQRERRLGRQQRFIRRQMEALASTLEDEARQALLDELRQIEMETRDPQSAQTKGVSDELGLIALGFSRLATRVSTQQVQLVGLIRDLREALEDKRRLISLQQELEIARTMQLSILPQVFPDTATLGMAARMIPAKEVGGDFYDIFPLDDRRIAFTIADVSGKGIPAAFFMLITRTMLRAVAESGVGPAETLRRVNNLLAAENEQMMFVTVFYAELDLETGELAFSNGGHNPPLRVRADGRVEVLPQTPGIALAAMPDMPFGAASLRLEDGDLLVMFTDGVTEAFSADGVMFGDKRLEEAMAGGRFADARETLEGVLGTVGRFTVGAPQSDDITCLVAHWRKRIT